MKYRDSNNAQLVKEIEELRRKIESLQKSEAYFLSIIEEQSDLICSTLPDLTITFANKSFCQCYGQDKEAVVGRKLTQLLSDLERNVVIENLASLNEKNAFANFTLINNSETVTWQEWRARAITRPDGQITEFQLIGRDITKYVTAEMALKNSENRFLNIIDFLPDPTFVIDCDGRVIVWNQAIEEISGVMSEDIIGKGNYEYALPFYGERRPMLIDKVIAQSDIDPKEYNKIEKKNHTVMAEVYLPSLEGSEVFIWAKATPIFDTDGKIVGAIESIRDITDRKKTERALQESEEKFRRLADTIPAFIFVYQGTKFKFVNSGSKYNSYDESDFENMNFWDVVHPDHKEIAKQRGLARQAGKDVPNNYELKVMTKNGKVRWVDLYAALLDYEGKPAVIGVVYDITKRKRAEMELKESQQRLADIINFLPDPTFAINIQGEIITWNRAMERTTKVAAKDILGKGNHEYSQVFYGERRPTLIDLVLDSTIELGSEYRFIKRDYDNIVAELEYLFDGSKKYFLCKATPLYDTNGQIVGAIESIRSITKRILAEEALKKSEESYRRIVETANEGIWIIDDKTRTIFANWKMCEMLECDPEDLIGKKLADFIDPEWFKLGEMHLRRRKKGIVEQHEFKFRKKNGDSLWALVSATPFFNEDGTYAGSLRMITDITERKMAEDALRASEEKFFKAFNSSPTLMTITTVADGKYIEVNDSFLNVTGYTREEIQGKSALEINFWANSSERDKYKKMILNEGKIRNLEFQYLTKEGKKRIGLLSAEPLLLNGEQYMINSFTDITELRQIEDEMARLAQLNLVGEISASIGHEIRNPMTSVRGFLQMLRETDNCRIYSDYFDLMIEELDRANAIITEFLSLAKNKTVDLQQQDLNSIIESLAPLIQANAMAQDKHVRFDLSEIPDLLIDQKEIRQVILNLVCNGLEAMSTGGNLTISTRAENNEVVLSVQDEGKGIEPGLIKDLGIPFFSTKENGTGLGLSICYSIAARHNATIDVETSDKGTTFSVRFKNVDK
ncbi:MAG: PAS domain S-box protein [Syntrophomonadaceae bacterium]|jgi:two-component system, sporulation sensor kinase E